MRDRARGAFIGLLVGDAIGSRVEFRTAERIAELFPDGVDKLGPSVAWAKLDAQITDDGEMAITLARALLSHTDNMAAIHEAYKSWILSGPYDMGNTIYSGVMGTPNPDSKSNGSLMRCTPMAIYCAGKGWKESYELGYREAGLTHVNDVPRQLTGLYVAVMSYLIAGGHAGDSIGHLQYMVNQIINAHPEVDRIMNSLGDKPAFEAAPIWLNDPNGYVGFPFLLAMYHMLHDTPYLLAVKDAISYGGDTDTNAAIVGALVGARRGMEDIPTMLRYKVLSCRPGGPSPRPKKYWPHDVVDLSVRLLP